jgi:hypothetical protein
MEPCAGPCGVVESVSILDSLTFVDSNILNGGNDGPHITETLRVAGSSHSRFVFVASPHTKSVFVLISHLFVVVASYSGHLCFVL